MFDCGEPAGLWAWVPARSPAAWRLAVSLVNVFACGHACWRNFMCCTVLLHKAAKRGAHVCQLLARGACRLVGVGCTMCFELLA